MKNFYWGFMLVALGTLLLLDNLGVADMGEIVKNFWPLLLIVLGFSVLRGRRKHRHTPSTGPYPGTPQQFDADFIQQSSVFGDTELAVRSQNFRGGSVSSVFGDTHIDLTAAAIAQGEYTLHIHTVFGDTRVLLPPTGAIAVSGNTTFGTVQILGQKKEGVSSFAAGNTPEYQHASNRLKITITKTAGDLYVS